ARRRVGTVSDFPACCCVSDVPRPAVPLAQALATSKSETRSLPRTALRSALCWAIIGGRKDGVGQPALEFGVVAELLEKLGVVLHQPYDHAGQRLVVFDPRVLFVRVLLGVLVGRIGRNLVRDLRRDESTDAICIRPSDVAE